MVIEVAPSVLTADGTQGKIQRRASCNSLVVRYRLEAAASTNAENAVGIGRASSVTAAAA